MDELERDLLDKAKLFALASMNGEDIARSEGELIAAAKKLNLSTLPEGWKDDLLNRFRLLNEAKAHFRELGLKVAASYGKSVVDDILKEA